MTDMFGQYKSQESRLLASIDSSKYPDTNADLEATLGRTVEFVDYIAQYLQVMQKGVDQANMDIITRTRDIFTNLAILIGGGSIGDIDFGDLQYFFPVIGALFGFDADTPFPINLFHAAERFFLGYVVPLDSFAYTISDMIIGFMNAIGLSEDFIDAWREVFDELIELGSTFGELFGALWDLLDIFDLGGDGSGFGIFADIWHVVTSLFGGLSFDDLLGFADPVFDLLAPWVKVVARLVDWFSQVVRGFAGGIENLDGILNFAGLFGIIDFLDDAFGVEWAWRKIVEGIMLPFNLLIGPSSPFNAANIFGLLEDLNIPFIPLSHLSNQVHPNLLVTPDFALQDSIKISGPGWEWDGTTGRNSNGCAHATGGSIERMLRSVKVKVASDQAVTCKVWAKWNGIFYTGTSPITMDLVRYIDNVEVGRTTLASFTNPATNQPGWIQLVSDEYEIPNDNTNYVELQLRVRNNMSSGDVWFDDAELRKTKDTIPQGWVQNLLDDLGGLGEFIQNVIDAIISAIRGIPFIGGNIAALISWITGWKDETEDTAAQATDAYIGLDVTQKIITAAAQGTPLSPDVITTAPDELVQAALELQTSSIISMGSQIEQLQSQLVGSETSGNRVLETFEEVTTGTPPPNWEVIQTQGTPGSAWIESPDGKSLQLGQAGGSATVMGQYTGPDRHTQTNFQRVTATIARSMEYPFLDGRRPAHGVVARYSDDRTKWVAAYYDNSNRLVVAYRNGAASGELLNTGQDWVRQPGPGSSLGLEAGVGTDPYLYRIWSGNTPLITVPDNLHVTDINQFGHGVIFRSSGDWVPGAFAQYVAVDNKQIQVPGYGFRVFRSGTGGIGKGANAKLDFFDVEAEDTDDGWDAINQKYVVPKTGWWVFKIRVGGANSQTGSPAAALALYIDSAVAEYGNQGLRNNSWTNTPADSLTGTFGPYPLQKGQVVEAYMAYTNNINYNCIGDAGGTKTSFSGSLMSGVR